MGEFVEDPDWRGHVDAKAKEYLRNIAEQVLGDAKMHTPVDTGRLRESMRIDIEGSTAHIGSDLKYSLYVEEGHRVVVGDGQGHKKWTGKTVEGKFMLQRALYKTR